MQTDSCDVEVSGEIMPTAERQIRLVHVTTVPQSLGFVSGQVRYMKARGFEVFGLSSPGPFLSLFSSEEGIAVQAVEMPRRITPLRDLIALAKVWRYFRTIRPKIVHAHTPKGGLLGMLAGWLARVPIRIYHMHGLPFLTSHGWKRRLLMWSEYISCSLAHRVLCVSSSVREIAVREGLCPSDTIHVLLRGSCNGVDAITRFNPATVASFVREATRRKYGIPQDASVIGFVGRLARAKGLIELVAAWTILRDEFKDAHLLVVGPDEPGDPLPPEVEQILRNDARIHVIGEEWETPPLYKAMDILALPTHREGFPIVLLEAAAMKLPIVATTVSGCIDAVQDRVTGLLVPPYDPGKLAEALRCYLRDPELRSRHGMVAREWILRDFSEEAIWQAVYEEYLEMLEDNRIPAPDAGIAATLGETSKKVGRARQRLAKTSG